RAYSSCSTPDMQFSIGYSLTSRHTTVKCIVSKEQAFANVAFPTPWPASGLPLKRCCGVLARRGASPKSHNTSRRAPQARARHGKRDLCETLIQRKGRLATLLTCLFFGSSALLIVSLSPWALPLALECPAAFSALAEGEMAKRSMYQY